MENVKEKLKVSLPDEAYLRKQVSCQEGCPVHTDARGYVRAIAQGRFEEAYLIARAPNPFASICGRICGAPCEQSCRRGKVPLFNEDGSYLRPDDPISIRALKRFVCQRYGVEAQSVGEILPKIKSFEPRLTGHIEEMAQLLKSISEGAVQCVDQVPVAIIGAGPAGLSAAHDLALLGFSPVVFESEPYAAGMLRFGVPSYRLPVTLIEREVAMIEALGVEIRCNTTVGKDVHFDDLVSDYAAVIIAVGAKRARSMAIPGERGPGVLGGVDMLREVALGKSPELGKRVLVIGGGNVAYDVARTVLRQATYDTARTAARLPHTGEVHLVSLETLDEMPADTVEILEGDEEGIIRHNGWGPLGIIRGTDGSVTGVEFRRCLRVYDADRRFSPQFDDQDRQVINCDTVLVSIGQMPDLSFIEQSHTRIEMFRPGWPTIDQQTLQTTHPGVFVAGDLAHGTRLMIHAIASGKAAARSVYRYISGRELRSEIISTAEVLAYYRREKGYEGILRVEPRTTDVSSRLASPTTPIEEVYSQEEAVCEAGRCLDCGVSPVFDGSKCILCGGCVDVCPTVCLKISSLQALEIDQQSISFLMSSLGLEESDTLSAIIKDDDRCIRCGLCEQRCPNGAITMERVQFSTKWRSL